MLPIRDNFAFFALTSDNKMNYVRQGALEGLLNYYQCSVIVRQRNKET